MRAPAHRRRRGPAGRAARRPPRAGGTPSFEDGGERTAGSASFLLHRAVGSARALPLAAARKVPTAPKKLGRTRAAKAKRKKVAYGKNRRILRAVREAVPLGDGRAGQAGDRCRGRHARRHHRAGHGRHSKQEKDYDFFPLTVDFIEKMYAVGRIPGGYLKREARPSDKGTLTARMVDRPIRPGFVDGFKREVHIVCTTLVVDSVNPPDTICVDGRERRAHAGRRPLRRPGRLRAHRPQRRNGRVHREPHVRGVRALRPRAHHRRHGRLHLHGGSGRRRDLRRGHAGRHDVRPGGHRRVLRGAAALPRPREHPAASSGRCTWPTPPSPSAWRRSMDEMSAALHDADKLSRMGKVEELKERIKAEQFSDEERAAWKGDIAAELKKLEKKAMRAMVIDTGERADGRACRRDPPAVHRAGLPAPRARLGPVPARPDPGALRGARSAC